jgi:phosphohistidine swiveling domain-containing protein
MMTPAYQPSELLHAIRRGEATLADYLERFGHRSPYDYELSEPRFFEDPSPITRLLALTPIRAGKEEPAPAKLRSHSKASSASPFNYARLFEVMKDRAKDLLAREIALIRKGLFEIGRRRGLGDAIFHLTLEEIEDLPSLEPAHVMALAEERKREREVLIAIEPGAALSVRDIEALGVCCEPKYSGGDLAGEWVSGTREVEGVARVLHGPADFMEVKSGEILVAQHLSPELTVLFDSVGGIVTEIGGMLSHAAIVAREYELPAVVGVTCACEQIRTGDRIVLRRDGRIDILKGATCDSGVVVSAA